MSAALGLFGTVGNYSTGSDEPVYYTGTVQNLKVLDANITTSGGDGWVGILTGFAQMAVIENCATSGKITTNHTVNYGDLVGGLAGLCWYKTVIRSCYSTAELSCTGPSADADSPDSVGGLVGQWEASAAGAAITDCWFGGSVKSNFNNGVITGLLGIHLDYESEHWMHPAVTIKNCLIVPKDMTSVAPDNILWGAYAFFYDVSNCWWPAEPADRLAIVDLDADPQPDQSGFGTASSDFLDPQVLQDLQTNQAEGVQWVAGKEHPTFIWDTNNAVYTVTLDPNGGTAGTGSVMACNNEDMPAVETLPTCEGYTFDGYYDAQTGGTQYYSADGTSAKKFDKGSDTTLYAHWSPVDYSITYNLDGGANSPANPSSYNIESEDITLADPTKPGKAFAGWYDNADFSGSPVTTIAKGSMGDRTFYAKWSASLIRIYGNTRYETAQKIADSPELNEWRSADGKFESVIVAAGLDFPDAVAGSALAVKEKAPILLVNSNDISATVEYIRNNVAEDGHVYILGGTGAVPVSFETAMDSLSQTIEVTRLGGLNRYETDLQILDQLEVQDGDEIIVATGMDYADSLSASSTGKPILIVGNQLTDTQKAFFASHQSSSVVIVGGTGAVNETVEKEIASYVGVSNITRKGGANRYETSALVAEYFTPNATRAVLAYGLNFPDGLCGGPIAYMTDSPLILVTDAANAQAMEYMNKHEIHNGITIGGPALISDATVHSIFENDSEILVR